jgi:hypothetical protein
MMVSDVLITLDSKHPDKNTLHDIIAALGCIGAKVIEVNPEEQVIEAIVPTSEVPTLEAMGGVAYVRSVFTYIAPDPKAAA